MNRFAVILPQRYSDLAHEVVTENLDAIVDDILDEWGTSTIVLSSDLPQAELVSRMQDYLPREEMLVFPIC
jgi:hypothetical protein